LIRNIDQDKKRQIIVRNLVALFNELNIIIIAEDIETKVEYHVLQGMGINLFQKYYFAKHSFESLSEINWT